MLCPKQRVVPGYWCWPRAGRGLPADGGLSGVGDHAAGQVLLLGAAGSAPSEGAVCRGGRPSARPPPRLLWTGDRGDFHTAPLPFSFTNL